MAEEENELKLPSDLRMCTTAHTQINIIKLKKKKESKEQVCKYDRNVRK